MKIAKRKVWYVLKASMFTQLSKVKLYGSEEEARAEYDKVSDSYWKKAVEDGWTREELLDLYDPKAKLKRNSVWFHANVTDGEEDLYLEIGSKEVELNVDIILTEREKKLLSNILDLEYHYTDSKAKEKALKRIMKKMGV